MELMHWLTLAGLCFLGVLSPGPSWVVIVRHTVTNGRRHGLVASASHALGVGIFAMLVLSGVSKVMHIYPLTLQLLNLLCAIYLAWMGYLSMKAGNTQFDSESVKNQQGSLLTAARDGLFIVLFNPKIALFFAALLSQFIGSDLSWLDWVLLWAMISLIDGSCYTMITLLLSQPRTLQRLQRQGVWINRIIGLVLLSLSLRVLLTI